MLKIIFILISFLLTISPVYANYTLIVPSPKGTGTAIWGDIVANELSKYLKEKIVIVNIKGGKGNLGLETFKVKYKNLGKVYYDEIYPQMRDFIKQVETEKGLNLNSPVPELVFDQKSDQKNRKFKWKLELNDVNNQSIANAVVGKVPQTMKKAKPPTQSDIVKRNEQRNEALRMLQKNFDDGIYNVEEFKELRKEIMDKYKQGGQIDG